MAGFSQLVAWHVRKLCQSPISLLALAMLVFVLGSPFYYRIHSLEIANLGNFTGAGILMAGAFGADTRYLVSRPFDRRWILASRWGVVLGVLALLFVAYGAVVACTVGDQVYVGDEKQRMFLLDRGYRRPSGDAPLSEFLVPKLFLIQATLGFLACAIGFLCATAFALYSGREAWKGAGVWARAGVATLGLVYVLAGSLYKIEGIPLGIYWYVYPVLGILPLASLCGVYAALGWMQWRRADVS